MSSDLVLNLGHCMAVTNISKKKFNESSKLTIVSDCGIVIINDGIEQININNK